MKSSELYFDGIKPFDISVTYAELYFDSVENVHNSHIHEKCEIYVNLSGDISFMVENNIYPVKPGDVIITRPFEYHHCIYHSNKLHKHFWILLSSAGNESLLDAFFNRKTGEANHLSLHPQDTELLISLCYKMLENNTPQYEKYYDFFEFIKLLNCDGIINTAKCDYTNDVIRAIDYINSNFCEQITIGDIAIHSNVSINTLERHFLNSLNTTPSAYLRKKRLANATKLLSMGNSVTEASVKSGFSDYSNFISLFKKTYGITPLKYKKQINN